MLEMNIPLVSNPDILMAVKEQRQKIGWPKIAVGFAAETQNVFKFGREKMKRKGLDFIAINDVSDPEAGFAVENNRITLLDSQGAIYEIPLQSKAKVAENIVEYISQHLATGSSSSSGTKS